MDTEGEKGPRQHLLCRRCGIASHPVPSLRRRYAPLRRGKALVRLQTEFLKGHQAVSASDSPVIYTAVRSRISERRMFYAGVESPLEIWQPHCALALPPASPW